MGNVTYQRWCLYHNLHDSTLSAQFFHETMISPKCFFHRALFTPSNQSNVPNRVYLVYLWFGSNIFSWSRFPIISMWCESSKCSKVFNNRCCSFFHVYIHIAVIKVAYVWPFPILNNVKKTVKLVSQSETLCRQTSPVLNSDEILRFYKVNLLPTSVSA